MVRAQLLHLLWNSLQYVACSILLPICRTFAKPIHMKKRILKSKNQTLKKSKKSKWPHSGDCLIPCLFQTITEKHASSSHWWRMPFERITETLVSGFVQGELTTTTKHQLVSIFYLLPICPSWASFFSVFRFNFTNKINICLKTPYILCSQGFCRGFFLYQRRLLNDNESLLRHF